MNVGVIKMAQRACEQWSSPVFPIEPFDAKLRPDIRHAAAVVAASLTWPIGYPNGLDPATLTYPKAYPKELLHVFIGKASGGGGGKGLVLGDVGAAVLVCIILQRCCGCK